MDFSNKRIWIIGASAGIGAALARALAERGAKLVLSARDAGALVDLAEECGGAQVLPLDLAQPETLEQAVQAQNDNVALDAVICTAALYDPGRVSDLDTARVEAMLRVNVLGMIKWSAPFGLDRSSGGF